MRREIHIILWNLEDTYESLDHSEKILKSFFVIDLATDINRKISFLIVNLLRTTHGGSRYIVSGKNSLNGKGQSNLIGPNVSATEGTTPGLT